MAVANEDDYKIVTLSDHQKTIGSPWMVGSEHWIKVIVEEEKNGWTPVIPVHWDPSHNLPEAVIFKKKDV